jgi:hypothetical protein
MLMDSLLFWNTFIKPMLPNYVLQSTTNKQTNKVLTKSAKICQDQTKSTKGSAGISLQAQLAETEHENAKPQNEGAAVSRRMASSIRSGPVGARGVFNCWLLLLLSIILVFFLGYILSGGFFDDKLGVRGVTPPCAKTPFSASIFAIDFWRSFFRILAPFVVHFWVIFHVLSMLPASLFCYRFCIIFESFFNQFSERRFSENLISS